MTRTGGRMFFWAAMMGALLAASGQAGAEDTTALLIEKVLDEPAQVDFKEVTLEEVFGRLSKAMGIKFDLEQAGGAIGQLPYGRMTQISATLSGMSWRQAMGELFRPLALGFQVGRDRIYLFGTEELMRQPGRLNLAELEALVRLQNTRLDSSDLNLLKQINERTRLPFGLMVLGKRLEKVDKEDAEKVLSEAPQAASEVLDLYSSRVVGSRGPGTWIVKGEMENSKSKGIDIVVLPVAELMQMKLNRRINIEYRNEPIQKILQGLADQGGMELSYEPGCVALLDDNLRNNCSLVMRGGTIKSALEALVGMTGLGYTADEAGLHVLASDTLRTMAASRGAETARKSSPLACTLTGKLPGTDLDTMIVIREEDLQNAGVLEAYRKLQQERFRQLLEVLKGYQEPNQPAPAKEPNQ